MSNPLIEALADHAHAVWAGWMIYMFGLGKRNSSGSITLPAEKVERWTRQMVTGYSELPETEKLSDRKIAEEYIEIFREAYDPYSSGWFTKNEPMPEGWWWNRIDIDDIPAPFFVSEDGYIPSLDMYSTQVGGEWCGPIMVPPKGEARR